MKTLYQGSPASRLCNDLAVQDDPLSVHFGWLFIRRVDGARWTPIADLKPIAKELGSKTKMLQPIVKPDLVAAYNAGWDAGRNGPSTQNCEPIHFMTPARAQAWTAGKTDATIAGAKKRTEL